MFNKDLLLIDIEATGLGIDHEIIQLAGILLDKHTLSEKKSFSSFIKPNNWEGRQKEAMEVNQIDYKQLEEAPTAKEVLTAFDEQFGNDVILSYYVGIMDITFLMKTYASAGLQYPFDYHVFNIWGPIYVYMAKQGILNNPEEFAGFTLEDCITHFKLALPENLHDALVDCQIEAEVLRRVLK